jgi:hypothetical protein
MLQDSWLVREDMPYCVDESVNIIVQGTYRAATQEASKQAIN